MSTDITKMSGDQFDVYLGADANPIGGIKSISIPQFSPDLTDVKSVDDGGNVLGQMVDGVSGEITLESQYRTRAEMFKYCPWLTVSGVVAVPKVGTFLPTIKVRVHNKNDGADTTRDVVFLAVAFRFGAPSTDGIGEATVPLIGKVCVDPTGNIIEFGYAAP